MILVCFAFAFIAFIIASNIFGSFWAWLASGGVVFALMAIIFTYELWTLLVIFLVIFILLIIGMLIAKQFNKS